MSAVRVLERETIAASRLLTNLRAVGDAEEQDIIDSVVEGETGLYEAIAQVVSEIDKCEINEIGLKAKEEAFTKRREAFGRRKELLRAAIEAAMVEAEQTTIRLDSRTIYLSKIAPNVVIESEADIPARFWTEPEAPAPKLDKKALKAALTAKEEVPGARLDNGSLSLRMRT